jgi:carbonic anhydrase/acetyltransferase-like protein (isoleucine patch superfamily)
MGLVVPFRGHSPLLGEGVWLAPNATVIGNATLGAGASVWFGAVIRADHLAIILGARTNVQDNAVLHITNDHPVAGDPDARGVPVGCRIGADVTIGHAAVVHACTIGDRVLVGIGAIVLDGAVVGDDCVIAAGSVVTPGTVIPPGMMVMGRPAKPTRALTERDRFWSQKAAGLYVQYAHEYATEGSKDSK